MSRLTLAARRKVTALCKLEIVLFDDLDVEEIPMWSLRLGTSRKWGGMSAAPSP